MESLLKLQTPVIEMLYTSWSRGDDATGDGTPQKPYKTMTGATVGMTKLRQENKNCTIMVKEIE